MDITARVANRTPIHLVCRTDSGTSRKYIFGWPAARSRAAWWVVFERYDSLHGFARKPYPARLRCECGELEDGEHGDRRAECPIHDPNTGYIARLHARVVRWLAAGYMLPDSGLKEE